MSLFNRKSSLHSPRIITRSQRKSGYNSKLAIEKTKTFILRHQSNIESENNLKSFNLPISFKDASFAYKNKKKGKNVPYYYGYYSSKWGDGVKDIVGWIKQKPSANRRSMSNMRRSSKNENSYYEMNNSYSKTISEINDVNNDTNLSEKNRIFLRKSSKKLRSKTELNSTKSPRNNQKFDRFAQKMKSFDFQKNNLAEMCFKKMSKKRNKNISSAKKKQKSMNNFFFSRNIKNTDISQNFYKEQNSSKLNESVKNRAKRKLREFRSFEFLKKKFMEKSSKLSVEEKTEIDETFPAIRIAKKSKINSENKSPKSVSIRRNLAKVIDNLKSKKQKHQKQFKMKPKSKSKRTKSHNQRIKDISSRLSNLIQINVKEKKEKFKEKKIQEKNFLKEKKILRNDEDNSIFRFTASSDSIQNGQSVFDDSFLSKKFIKIKKKNWNLKGFLKLKKFFDKKRKFSSFLIIKEKGKTRINFSDVLSFERRIQFIVEKRVMKYSQRFLMNMTQNSKRFDLKKKFAKIFLIILTKIFLRRYDVFFDNIKSSVDDKLKGNVKKLNILKSKFMKIEVMSRLRNHTLLRKEGEKSLIQLKNIFSKKLFLRKKSSFNCLKSLRFQYEYKSNQVKRGMINLDKFFFYIKQKKILENFYRLKYSQTKYQILWILINKKNLIYKSKKKLYFQKLRIFSKFVRSHKRLPFQNFHGFGGKKDKFDVREQAKQLVLEKMNMMQKKRYMMINKLFYDKAGKILSRLSEQNLKFSFEKIKKIKKKKNNLKPLVLCLYNLERKKRVTNYHKIFRTLKIIIYKERKVIEADFELRDNSKGKSSMENSFRSTHNSKRAMIDAQFSRSLSEIRSMRTESKLSLNILEDSKILMSKKQFYFCQVISSVFEKMKKRKFFESLKKRIKVIEDPKMDFFKEECINMGVFRLCSIVNRKSIKMKYNFVKKLKQ